MTDPERGDAAVRPRDGGGEGVGDTTADGGGVPFTPEGRVVVRDVDAGGYKRRPEYAAGATGTVESIHGRYRPPDGGVAERLYSVRFEATDLWPDADRNGAVYVDLWETGLAPAGGER